jgi:hypothetical protein
MNTDKVAEQADARGTTKPLGSTSVPGGDVRAGSNPALVTNELAAHALQAVTSAAADLRTVLDETDEIDALLRLREQANAAWIVFDEAVLRIAEKADTVMTVKGK